MFGETFVGSNTSYLQSVKMLQYYYLRAENPCSEFGYCLRCGFCEDNN